MSGISERNNPGSSKMAIQLTAGAWHFRPQKAISRQPHHSKSVESKAVAGPQDGADALRRAHRAG